MSGWGGGRSWTEDERESYFTQARENEQTMRRLHQLEMRFLTADSLESLIDVVLDDCRDSCALDAVSIALLDPSHELRSLLASRGMDWQRGKRLQFTDSHLALQQQYRAQKQPLLGPFRASQHARLFPEGLLSSGSVAMLPLLRLGEWIGSLHLGSRDAHRYKVGMATDFLAHLGALLAVCVENSANQERLRRAGLVDMLTAVNNRRFFDQRLHEEISRAARHGAPLACLFFDIDHFKQVNDRYGHPVGDQVLAAVAQRIHSQLRNMDVLARYGGEEFVALLCGTDAPEAIEVAERVRRDLDAQHVGGFEPRHPDKERSICVTVSVGVAILDPGAAQADVAACAERLVERADRALYQAKHGGRNRVECLDVCRVCY